MEVQPGKTESDFHQAEQAAQHVLAQTPLRPGIGLVLGSGHGGFVDQMTEAVSIPFQHIPHYPQPSAAGHAGRLVVGNVEGVAVAAMQGRVHLYEGYSIQEVVFPIRVFARMGVQAVVLTNAAGGIAAKLKRGCLVVLQDHINLQGTNPLIGWNDERFGDRFVDMTNAYWPDYRRTALRAGRRLKLDIFEGVYAAMTGPSYETPAEIRYLRSIGADVVGMSTVAEVIAARHLGLRVLAISCVANMAAGILSRPITHKEVLETGERVKGQFAALLRAVIPDIAQDLQKLETRG